MDGKWNDVGEGKATHEEVRTLDLVQEASKARLQKEILEKTEHLIGYQIVQIYRNNLEPYRSIYISDSDIKRSLFLGLSKRAHEQLGRYAHIVDEVKQSGEGSWKELTKQLNQLRETNNGVYEGLRYNIEGVYGSYKYRHVNHFLRSKYQENNPEQNLQDKLSKIPSYNETIDEIRSKPQLEEEVERCIEALDRAFGKDSPTLPQTMVLKKDLLVERILPFVKDAEGEEITQLDKRVEGKGWIEPAYNSTSIRFEYNYQLAFEPGQKTARLFIIAEAGKKGIYIEPLTEKQEDEVLLHRESSIRFEKIHEFDRSQLTESDKRTLQWLPDYVIIARYRHENDESA